MNKSTITIVAVAALVCGVALSWVINRSQPPELQALRWLGDNARPLPEFELFDHNGGILNKDSLQDHWSLMFFGYTQCPDICPGSMQTMDQVIQAVEAQDIDNLKVYFVSVDPYRDTPELIKNYVEYFNEDIIGATNTEEKLRELTGPLGILHQVHRESEDDMDYLVDHSGYFLLFNPQAEFTGLFSAPHDAAVIAHDLVQIIQHY